MEQHDIIQYITGHFNGVDVVVGSGPVAEGDTFFIYDPERNLDDRHRFPFATIVTKDYGDFDNSSNLNRPGVWRLNVGVSRDTFKQLFPDPDATYDYTQQDRLMPHPVYGPQSWVCVLNPSSTTFTSVEPLIEEAYERAAARRS
ncbi:MAG: erythromycin esterase [Mycobacterium sp.]|nr:erythromycin esterase [Mycobacterium sp.]